MDDLLLWPNQPADVYDTLYERITNYSLGLGVCEETRELLLVHMKGMIENRPRTCGVVQCRPEDSQQTLFCIQK